jgi:hypothetical protein
MRDIRADLQERVKLLDDQLKAAQGQFDKFLQQIKGEHEAKIASLKAELDAVNHLLEIEHRRHGAPAPSPQAKAEPQRAAPQPPFADFLVRKLGELGPMSQDKLHRLAVQEGYFADGDAERGIQAVLMHVVKAGHVRQLPNGDFAEVIRLRRAV